MKITNKHGLPVVFEKLLERDDYTRGAASFSVTELLQPPRIRLLRLAHAKDMKQDVSDSLWALMGRAVHEVMQGGATEGTISEQRLFADFDGIKVSGALDLQVLNGIEVAIKDFKFTSVWSVMKEKPEWEQQLNCYAQLARMNDRQPIDLSVVAILRNWSQTEYERTAGSVYPYPQAPVMSVPIPLWDAEKAKQFINDRIVAHTKAHFEFEMNGQLPECTAEERWEKEATWAVIRVGNKRASKVFDSALGAATYAASLQVRFNDEWNVKRRGGIAMRCERNYCGVNQWCEQYARTRNSGKSRDGGNLG